MAEIQQQLPHLAQHMNTGDVIQIEVPDFHPDIDEVLPIPADQNTDHEEIQGSANSIQQFSKKTATTGTPASLQQDAQDVVGRDPSGNTATARSGHRTKYTYSANMMGERSDRDTTARDRP